MPDDLKTVCHVLSDHHIKKVPVLDGDTPETLAARVLETEHEILARGLERAVDNLKKGGK